MKDIWLIVRKEWIGFAKSDRGIFLVYSILVLAWSILLSSNINLLLAGAGYLWLIFFSVIVSGNFSNTTFSAERISGSLEILLTSGIARNAILIGKIAFVIIMSIIMGFLCYVLAVGIYVVKGENYSLVLSIIPAGSGPVSAPFARGMSVPRRTKRSPIVIMAPRTARAGDSGWCRINSLLSR